MNSPNRHLDRRTFLKSSALAAAASALPRFSIGQPGGSPNGKINVACIGIGNRGWYAVSELMKDPRVNIVAVCDVDQVLVNKTYRNAAESKKKGHLRYASPSSTQPCQPSRSRGTSSSAEAAVEESSAMARTRRDSFNIEVLLFLG